MITVIERSGGWNYARDGQVVDHLTDAEAEQLQARLTDALRPVSTAVSPAKARLRPPIMRYPAKAAS